jgi:hypothetical protein
MLETEKPYFALITQQLQSELSGCTLSEFDGLVRNRY